MDAKAVRATDERGHVAIPLGNERRAAGSDRKRGKSIARFRESVWRAISASET